MYSLGSLLRKLDPYIIESSDGAAGKRCTGRVEFLDSQEVLCNDRIYLGGVGAVLKKDMKAAEGAVILLGDSMFAKIPEGAVLVRLSCHLPRLYNIVSDALSEMELRHRADREAFDGIFRRYWEEIIERRINSTPEIREALTRTSYPPGEFVQVAVVTFAEKIEIPPFSDVLVHLRRIFPQTNIAVWQREIVLLLTYRERSFCRRLPEKELAQVLSQYDAFIAVGNGTRDYSTLSFQYSLVCQCTQLARKLELNGPSRIFYFEEYSIYCAIDLCAQRFFEMHHSNDIIYLIHPAVVHLTRYDKIHNSNLRDVLFYYLRNGRNLVKTASDTYMHRNTVINKVNRITELVDLDLDNDALRQRLLFSCQIIRYYDKVLNLELKL